MADMGEWSLGLVKKQCLLDEWEEFQCRFSSDWLTDVAFFFFFFAFVNS